MPYGTVLADLHNDSLGNKLAPASAVFRNRIINGAMVIDQRNAGASYTPPNNSNYNYSLDRWCFYNTQTSKFTTQQNAGSVTPPVGFTNYLGVTSSSAYSVTASDIFVLRQAIEGYNIADLGWGTANAKTVTLSFWVYSSLTGTFGGALSSNAASYSYPFSYSISVANTWTQINITIAGPTASTWYTNNNAGINVCFGLGVGSTGSGTAGSWQAAGLFSATGATSVVGTSGATFYITGVQLEVGTNATSFDYRPYGTELALCQRYFNSSFSAGTAPANNINAGMNHMGASPITNYVFSTFFSYPVEMRTVPTVTYYSSNNGTATNGVWQIYNGGWGNASSLNGTNTITKGFQPTWSYTGAVLGTSYYSAGNYTASAEL